MTDGWRGWWREVLLGLATAGLGLATTRMARPGVAREEWAEVFAVLAGLALVAVRRWPWPVLLAESALMVVGGAVTLAGGGIPQLAGAVALGYVAYRCGRSATVAGYALYLGATLGDALQRDAGVLSGGTGVIRLVLLAGVVAAPVAFGRYLRGVRQAAAAAEERAREVEERRAAETRAARLAERAGVARDLHDIVAHHIAAIALRAGAARYAVQHTGRTDEAVSALGELRDTAGQVLDELRELLEVLRDPEAVEPTDPQVEPEQVIRDAARRVREAGVAVQVSVSPALAWVPLVVGTTAARVVQEALTNTLKHAGPGAIASVDVQGVDGALLLEVLDSGPVRQQLAEPERGRPGRPALPASGYGLSGMRERVGLLGGTLTATGTEGGGWRVQARLPVRENR
ncbi:histidine kinase [Micromonospora sp. DR5-3]|uniref:sensor histidine kinase n=1 Tax=unclassified Micromonospora TaxID=2617518 RepID=UPI0011DAD554|nr:MULTISPECIES: histidine kinase [unclassified Micromonospora]MCW3818731.1 histidine kinase [Micromonospora sp. DR5-3]TYC21616.1 two-component sensor histidine kinase [Micromonospora sp. MP36]